jgi:hypothetical protein
MLHLVLPGFSEGGSPGGKTPIQRSLSAIAVVNVAKRIAHPLLRDKGINLYLVGRHKHDPMATLWYGGVCPAVCGGPNDCARVIDGQD